MKGFFIGLVVLVVLGAGGFVALRYASQAQQSEGAYKTEAVTLSAHFHLLRAMTTIT